MKSKISVGRASDNQPKSDHMAAANVDFNMRGVWWGRSDVMVLSGKGKCGGETWGTEDDRLPGGTKCWVTDGAKQAAVGETHTYKVKGK